MEILKIQFLLLDFWSLALYNVNGLQTYFDKKGIDYNRMFPWQNAVF